jgi:AcrR family transcriptional regulator
MPRLAVAPNSTARFEKKREAIIAAATRLINQRGVHGMTLKAVAGEVGLITNSVTYYFKRKDDLAVVCFEEGAARIAAMLKEALRAPDPPARVRRFVELSLENERRMRRGEEPPLPIFSDVRALPDAQRAKLAAVFSDVFSTARELFRAPGYEWVGSHGRTVRALLVMENFYWAAAWLADYDIEDLTRVGQRYFEILANGVAREDAAWRPPPMTAAESGPTDRQARARLNYLMAATRLINRKGYRAYRFATSRPRSMSRRAHSIIITTPRAT